MDVEPAVGGLRFLLVFPRLEIRLAGFVPFCQGFEIVLVDVVELFSHNALDHFLGGFEFVGDFGIGPAHINQANNVAVQGDVQV